MKRIVLLACVLLILVPTLALAGCGGSGGGSAQSAEQAAKDFFTAYQNKDAATTWKLLSADSAKDVKEEDWKTFLEGSDDVKFKVGKVTVNGDKATASVTATLEGESSTENVPLVKEDGVWKINMAGIAQ